MKVTNYVTFFLLKLSTVFSQEIQFKSPLVANQSFVCQNGSITLSAASENAKTYEFQIKNLNSGEFENTGIGGNLSVANEPISHTFTGITQNDTYRIKIANDSVTIFSNEISLNLSNIQIHSQPIDLVQCNGLNVNFYTNVVANNDIIYQWYQSLNGGSFNPLTNSTKIGGANSNNLQIKNLTNADHGSQYYCLIKDANGCEIATNTVNLSVNQLSTVVSPTTATKFCEGDIANFLVGGNVGNIVNMQWSLKKSTASSYSNLSDDGHFSGVNTMNLTVNGINIDENSYRFTATFTNLLQSPDGSGGSGTCDKSATRTSYVINARPPTPAPLADQTTCGASSFTFIGPSEYYWYNDANTTNATFVKEYQTPFIEHSQQFYFSTKDAHNCESLRQGVHANINPKPTAEISNILSVCPDSKTVNLIFNNITNGANKFSLSSNLPDFIPIGNQDLTSNYELTLPDIKNSGNYTLWVKFKNEETNCISDSVAYNFNVAEIIKWVEQPVFGNICETNYFQAKVQIKGSGPFVYNWFKNEALVSQNETLEINSVSYADAGLYKVKISGQCGTVNSDEKELVVLAKNEILEQPIAQEVCENNAVQFSVKATGTGKLHYQWYINNASIGIDSSILIIEKTESWMNNAQIYCEVSSDCSPNARSNSVELIVNPLPPAPNIVNQIGYCQNAVAQALNPDLCGNCSETWFDENGNVIEKPTVVTTKVDTLKYFVSQTDTKSCVSPRSSIQIVINPTIELSINKSLASLCTTGLINKSSQITCSISGDFQANTFYELLENSIVLNSNAEGIFSIDREGEYTINSSKGYCQNAKTFTIGSLSNELNLAPKCDDAMVCAGGNVELIATSDYENGHYAWWNDATTLNQITNSNILQINGVSHPVFRFVSYMKTFEGIECESPRKEVSVTLKPNLTAEISVQNTTCTYSHNGIIKVESVSGIAPHHYIIDGQNNADNIFRNLTVGDYAIQILDFEGCKMDSSIRVNYTYNPKIVTQPTDIRRCKGNQATFSVKAEDYNAIIWQKKSSSDVDFVDIANSNLTTIKIDNIGNATYPDLTKFRAIVLMDSCQVISNEVTLFVTSISGTIPAQTVCEASNLNFNLSTININGTIQSYQWQYRSGTSGSFVDLASETNAELNLQNVNTSQTGYYRCKMIFDNSDGNTCIINTSSTGTKLTIEAAEIPTLGENVSICSGQSTQISASNCSGKYFWNDGQIGQSISVSPAETAYYRVSCQLGTCERWSVDSLRVEVNGTSSSTPILSVNKARFCKGDSIIIYQSGCNGTVNWSNGFVGGKFETIANESFNISANCLIKNCTSPSGNELKITVATPIDAGEIQDNHIQNCVGYLPPTINSVRNSSGGIALVNTWQMAINCDAENIAWNDIPNENQPTFNPPVLKETTCFRRIAKDSCGNLAFTNVVKFEIYPNPDISISANKAILCYGDSIQFASILSGGVSNCTVIWQKNEASSNWVDIGQSPILSFTNNETLADKKIYFRASYACDLSACLKKYSNIIAVDLLARNNFTTNFSDSTICDQSSTIRILALNCKGSILWGDGSTLNSIEVSPKSTTNYSVTCSDSCSSQTKNVNINVIQFVDLPTNTTPDYVFEGETLIFSALGENLKWYADATTATFTSEAPEFTNSGTYEYYVSQTVGNCESARLKIVASIKSDLRIISQPISQSNCGGNTVNFSIQAQGVGTLNYQWQRKKIGENDFVNLTAIDTYTEGINTQNLKIKYVGNTYNPDQTEYRCLVSDSLNSLLSEIVILNVNVLKGSLASQKLCKGQNLVLDLNQNHLIIGNPNYFQWQKRKGTGMTWENMQDSTNISGTNTKILKIENVIEDFQYRCIVNFNSSSGTCFEYSNGMQLTVIDYPHKPANLAFEFCQNSASTNLTIPTSDDLKNIWYLDSISTTSYNIQPVISTTEIGKFNLYYAQINTSNCESTRAKIEITIIETPNLPINNTPSNINEGETLKFSAIGENLKWYADATTATFTSEAPEFTNSGTYEYYVSQTVGNCESARLKIVASIKSDLRIISQPINQSNCGGNTVNFSIQAQGVGTLNYQWQRKKVGENDFVNLTATDTYTEGINTQNLKIKYVGNTYNPDQTEYRCLVSDSLNSLLSEIVILNVNYIKGSLASQKLCKGQNLILDLNQSHLISGNPNYFQWQKRKGTGMTWENMQDSTNISGTNTKILKIENVTEDFQYRCIVNFNSSSGTCLEYTDLMSLSVYDFPIKPQNLIIEYCQNATSKKINVDEPSDLSIIWFPGDTTLASTTKQPKIPTEIDGHFKWYYAFKNAANCESSKALIEIIIHPQPNFPINTTPLWAYDDKPFKFSIEGNNLKWYTSKTGKTFSTEAPVLVKKGKYKYYVTQTNDFGCESERLLVEIEILPSFAIATQPTDQFNCEGNTVTFSIKIKGGVEPGYQWQKRENKVFVNLLNETAKDLKIAKVGDSLNPNLSEYRCIVYSEKDSLVSQSAFLHINGIIQDIENQVFCDNEKIGVQDLKLKTQGEIVTVDWQKKVGSTYQSQFVQNDTLSNYALDSSKNGLYRLKIIFKNKGSLTCTRYTNIFELTLNKSPKPIVFAKIEACQFESTASIIKKINVLKTNFYDDQLNQIDAINTQIIGIQKYFVKQISDEGCPSDLQELNIEIHNLPKNTITDSLFSYCQFDNTKNPLNPMKNVYWFDNESDEWPAVDSVKINKNNVGNFTNWVAITNEFGCLSPKKPIRFNINPCYLETKIDTCISLFKEQLDINNWNYFYNDEFKIYAGIHPMGQDLGWFAANLVTSKNAFLLDSASNKLSPKYFNLNWEYLNNTNFKMRIFYSQNEKLQYQRQFNFPLNNEYLALVNYHLNLHDCNLQNDSLSNNYWVQGFSEWQKSTDANFEFVEFDVQKNGEYAVWQADFNAPTLNLEENNLPKLNISLNGKLTGGTFEILKSTDNKNWKLFKEFNQNANNFVCFDNHPNENANYYHLNYDFGNKMKISLNTVLANYDKIEIPCQIYPNPISTKNEIKLYCPGLNKASLKVNNLIGQEIELSKITSFPDYHLIKPKLLLNSGEYVLHCKNQNENICSFKFIVE